MEIYIDFNKTPNKGDVVWAFRLPFHCGIYENEDSVIHFAPLNGSKTKEDAVIHRSNLAEFANNSPVFVIEFPPEKCLPPEETINRARSRVGEHAYDLFLNNCDHFATWCKIGKHRSLQVDLAQKILVEAGKFIDKSGEKETDFEKGAEIFCLIYKIAEILSSREIKTVMRGD